MLIQKFCVSNADGDGCLQCRRRFYSKRRRLCSIYSAMQKKWPRVYEYLHEEVERLTRENQQFRSERDELREVVVRRAADIEAVKSDFRGFLSAVN